MSSFTVVETKTLWAVATTSGKGVKEQVSVLTCHGCRKGVVVIEARNPAGALAGVTWWPTPGTSTNDPAVPAPVAEAYAEGARSLAVAAPHAAVAMFRSALAQIVQDKGSEAAKKKGSLNDAVKQMVADGALWVTFGEWADHIRVWGNAGAHPEAFGPVSMEDAHSLEGLVKAMFDFLYIQPAKLERARPQRQGK